MTQHHSFDRREKDKPSSERRQSTRRRTDLSAEGKTLWEKLRWRRDLVFFALLFCVAGAVYVFKNYID